jgi:hypothetical protein
MDAGTCGQEPPSRNSTRVHAHSLPGANTRTARARLGALGLDVEVEVEDALDGPRGAGLRPTVSAEALASVPAAIRHQDYARARITCMARAPVRVPPTEMVALPLPAAARQPSRGPDWRGPIASGHGVRSRFATLRPAPAPLALAWPGSRPTRSATRKGRRFPGGGLQWSRGSRGQCGVAPLPVWDPSRHSRTQPCFNPDGSETGIGCWRGVVQVLCSSMLAQHIPPFRCETCLATLSFTPL